MRDQVLLKGPMTSRFVSATVPEFFRNGCEVEASAPASANKDKARGSALTKLGAPISGLSNPRLQATVGVGLAADKHRRRSPTAPEPVRSAVLIE